jgi:hypothetical protein
MERAAQSDARARHAPARALATWALFACALFACKEPLRSAHHPLAERAATHQLDAIEGDRVHGSLRGQPFEATHAYVRVVTMQGRERVDLLLSERPIEHCGASMARPGRRAWLRLPGTPRLDGRAMRVEADADARKAPLTTHYELPSDRGILAHGGGAALLSLRDTGFGRYRGALWTCFDDGEGSCLTGRFEASACRSELDVDDSVWGASRLDPAYPARMR